jgi:hypothetical protein
MENVTLSHKRELVEAPNYIMSNSLLGVVIGGLLEAKF